MDVAQNTLLRLEHRPNELGRIRLGQRITRNGKEYPGRLQEWRLTSASKALLDAAAALYGGTVQPWADAPDEGYYKLFTESRELRVLIPTALRTVSQAFEYWQGGTCERRCDGQVEQVSDQPCLCDPSDRMCDPVTRVSLMLPDVPGLGVWRLDTGGWNAATSLPATIELLKALSTQAWIPAILRLEQRSKKAREGDKVVTHRFAVPVLDLPGITVGKVVSRMGNGEAPRIEAGERPTQPTAAERAIERAAAVTGSSPTLAEHSATTRGEGDADTTPPAASLPRPAGARTDTPDPVPGSIEAGHPSDGAPTPAPDGQPGAGSRRVLSGSGEPGRSDTRPAPAAPDEVEPTGPDDPADDASQAAARADGPRPSPKCEGFSPEFGRCVREGGHEANHRSKSGESWKA